MNLFDEFFAIVREFHTEGIRYAVVGGIAMAFHDQPRFTRDIDLLIHPGDIESVAAILGRLGYFASASPWTFQKTKLTLHRFLKIVGEDDLMVDVLVGYEGKHAEMIEGALLEKTEQGDIRIARKEDIIWMKTLRDSDQDRVDIRKLQNDKN